MDTRWRMDIIYMLYENAFNVLRKHKIMFVFSMFLYTEMLYVT